MNEETRGALERVIKEVKEKREARCLNIDCVVNHRIGGNDIQLVEGWLDETKKEIEE